MNIAGTGLAFIKMSHNVSFGGRLIMAEGQIVITDRLGSVRARGTERFNYFPYGEEYTTSTQNRTKFGTYHRDGTGLDYAYQRYYASNTGRFMTADPGHSGEPGEPNSWNLYAYVGGDPINYYDPEGLTRCGDVIAEEAGGATLQQIVNANSNFGLLSRVTFAEGPAVSDNGTEGTYQEHLFIASSFVNRFDILHGNLVAWNAKYQKLDANDDKTWNLITQMGWGPIGSTLWNIIIKGVNGHSTDANGNLLDSYAADLQYALDTPVNPGSVTWAGSDKIDPYCFRLASAITASYHVLNRDWIIAGVTNFNRGRINGKDNPNPKGLFTFGRVNPVHGNTYYGVVPAGTYRQLPRLF